MLLVATPQQRVFYAVLSLLLGLVSWLTSNLGGFLVGMLLALVGGALAFAWTPDKRRQPTGATGTPGAPDPEDADEPEDEDEDGGSLLPGARTPDPTPAERG
ncbi:DUF6114 domain-containing protein [Micromonospora sp. NPDC023633]|uniref:DUF6114 domain-containing protein n=1 Tax=Micromonospora sp. NPDC023633 TaxID=3154320 RepID=UPI0033E216BE